MKKKIIAVIVALGIVVAGYFTTKPEQVNVGADLVSPIAGQTYTLAGSGMSSSDTSFTLSSFTITQNGYPIQDSDMSETFYITLEPGSRARQEIISCTTVGPNTGGQVLISGCVRGLAPITPYTASTSLAFAHSGGSTVIFSDPPQLFNQATFKANDETITGNWLFPTPLTSESAATKAYVDAVVSGTTTLSNDRLVVAGTAGETLATGTLVYFNGTTQRWNKVGANATSTFDDKFIGLTQGQGVSAGAIANGILLKGRDVTQTGMTPGTIYYAGTASGTISTTVSAQTLGIAVSATVLYFDPVWIDVPTENGDNTFTGNNIFNGTTTFNGAIVGATKIDVFTASSTWTKPTNAKYVEVIAIGGGGGGAGGSVGIPQSGGGGGGQGGGLSIFKFNASTLPSTVAVTVGAGGTGGAGKVAGSSGAGSNGTAGASSTFGTYLIAGGGVAGSGGLSGGTGGSGGGFGNIASGGAGASGNNTANAASAVNVSSFVPTGGGAGGGVSAAGAGFNGGAGGSRELVATLAGGTAGASNSGTGGAGQSFSVIDGVGGTGGGGGGGDDGSNAPGGIGASGGFPGGGGGGGGGSGSSGQPGGLAGSGSTGIVVVITY